MAVIIDEKQIKNTRLLILDEKKIIENNEVIINNKKYKTLDVYDLPDSLAIVCNENEKSFIGISI